MTVEANCIAECFDNAVKGQEPRFYYRGTVRNYNTSNRRLNGLTTPRGDWVFQYPGHEGKNPDWIPPRRVSEAVKVEQEPEPVRITAESKPDRRYRKKSKAAIAAMLSSRKANREAKKAKLEAEMAQESSAA